jgi:hypothetical protein
MADHIDRIRNGRRILTPKGAMGPGAIELPPGELPSDLCRVRPEDLAKTLPPDMVHTRRVVCSECETVFQEQIITPPGEAPKPRDPDERPDLCRNCFRALNRFPIIKAGKPRGTDVPRRI